MLKASLLTFVALLVNFTQVFHCVSIERSWKEGYLDISINAEEEMSLACTQIRDIREPIYEVSFEEFSSSSKDLIKIFKVLREVQAEYGQISFSSCYLGPAEQEEFILLMPKVKELIFYTTYGSLSKIIAALPESKKLSMLHLPDYELSEEEIKNVSSFLQESKAIKEIELINPSGNPSFSQVFTALGSNPHLYEITFYRMRLSLKDVEAFISALECRTLEKVLMIEWVRVRAPREALEKFVEFQQKGNISLCIENLYQSSPPIKQDTFIKMLDNQLKFKDDAVFKCTNCGLSETFSAEFSKRLLESPPKKLKVRLQDNEMNFKSIAAICDAFETVGDKMDEFSVRLDGGYALSDEEYDMLLEKDYVVSEYNLMKSEKKAIYVDTKMKRGLLTMLGLNPDDERNKKKKNKANSLVTSKSFALLLLLFFILQ